jgi:prophage DNA circulation protein
MQMLLLLKQMLPLLLQTLPLLKQMLQILKQMLPLLKQMLQPLMQMLPLLMQSIRLMRCATLVAPTSLAMTMSSKARGADVAIAIAWLLASSDPCQGKVN